MISTTQRRLWLAAAFVTLPVLILASLAPAPETPGTLARNRYVGAKACKSCHDNTAKGEQYQKWEQSAHAHAYETLAKPAALEAGKARGVDAPQKADACLKCHVTAFGADKREIKRGFEPELGVQCESCHGPGEQHVKARFKAATAGETGDGPQTLEPDEIVSKPGPAVCLGCHNDESPSFKPFCFKTRNQEILHLDPRKPRTDEELAALKCGCGDECGCVQAECSKAEAEAAEAKKAEEADKKAGEGKKG